MRSSSLDFKNINPKFDSNETKNLTILTNNIFTLNTDNIITNTFNTEQVEDINEKNKKNFKKSCFLIKIN